MHRTKTKNAMRGALLLTMAGLIGKILSAVYRIPLQNLTGDIGFYIYQQVYPIIGIGMILALYGYPTAVSKLVAERKNAGLAVNAAQVYIPITLILIGLNFFFALTVYIAAPQLALLLGDAELAPIYRMSSGLFLLIPLIAVLRGFYQGQEQMLPTAVSQVVEQLIRVTVIIGSAYLIFIDKMDLYAIGYAGIFASMMGMALAMLGWLFFLPSGRRSDWKETSVRIPWKHYIRTCLSLGVLAAVGHLILLLMQAVDVFTIVPSLLHDGVAEVPAKEMKGIFDRGQPLIQIGAVLGSSFALALVPSVVKDNESRAHATREALQFSFYIGAAASLGLMLLMPEVNNVLFMNTEGTASLRILVMAIVLSALLITGASILQSMGHVSLVAGFVFLSVVLKWLLNGLLVPRFHLMGSALGTVLSLFVLLLLVLWTLQRKESGISLSRIIRIMPFSVASGAMAIVVLGLKTAVHPVSLHRAELSVFVGGTVLVGAGIYIGILLYFRVFSDKQIEALPFGHRLLGVYEWLDQRKRG